MGCCYCCYCSSWKFSACRRHKIVHSAFSIQHSVEYDEHYEGKLLYLQEEWNAFGWLFCVIVSSTIRAAIQIVIPIDEW
jgi:hypothetical protein